MGNRLDENTSNAIAPKDLIELTQRTQFTGNKLLITLPNTLNINNPTMTGDEIREFYETFLIDCPKGFITIDQFREIYTSLFPGRDSTEFSAFVFRQYDSNGDGAIDFREFITGLSITTRGKIDEKLEWAFKMYDLDGNGEISKEEMLKVLTAIHKMVGSLKLMPEDEATPEMRTEAIFWKMDVNHDGHIDFAEFCEGVTHDASIMRLLQFDPKSTD